MINSMANFFLELIYPVKCLACGDIIKFGTKKYLCDKCKDKLKLIDNKRCITCSRPIVFNNLQNNLYCDFCFYFYKASCKAKKNFFDKNYSFFEYDNTVADIIHRFKFKNHPQIGVNLAKIISQNLTKDFLLNSLFRLDNIDYIIPVPIHKFRMRERGFNQSEILAREISKKISIPVRTDILKRKKNTKPQWELDIKSRENNIQNAFINKKNIFDKNILLIDDIFTTGSTINECAKTLKNSGANLVFSLTIAITSKK